MANIRALLGVRGLDRKTEKDNPNTRKWANIFEAILVVVLIWLPIQWYLQSNAVLTHAFIQTSDWIIWAIFLCETATLTALINNKKKYLQENWMNLFIIVVAFPPFWAHSSGYLASLRALRFLIMFRLTAVQFRYIVKLFRVNRFGTTLIAFFVITILSGIVGSFLDPTLAPPWKGIWWAWETVTTVGYGDVVPHTASGKIFASFLMVLGIGLISIVAANFAAFLIGHADIHHTDATELKDNLKRLNERLDDLEKTISNLDNSVQKKITSQN